MYSKRYNSFVSPKKLSKLLKSGKIFPILSSTIWCKLIGQLITCPICNRKAVIIPFDFILPIVETHHTPCHCSISMAQGYIAFHWCVDDNRDDNKENERNQYWSLFSPTTENYGIPLCEPWDNGIDVCKSFGKFIKDSYKI